MAGETLYFGHPVNIYGTGAEDRLMVAIANAFPGDFIENPNQPQHDEGYKVYGDVSIDPVMQERMSLEDKRGMNYYFLEVLPFVDGGVFLAFEDGMIGKGVYGEAEFLQNHGKPIYELGFTKGGLLFVARYNGCSDGSDDHAYALFDESRCLSILETRERVRGPNKGSLEVALNESLDRQNDNLWIRSK